jgi:hypothetical protein
MAAYRIGEDQVMGSLHCGILGWLMTATGSGPTKRDLTLIHYEVF